MAPVSDNSAAPADETKVRSKIVNNRATAAAMEWAWQKSQAYKTTYRKKKSGYLVAEQELDSSVLWCWSSTNQILTAKVTYALFAFTTKPAFTTVIALH